MVKQNAVPAGQRVPATDVWGDLYRAARTVGRHAFGQIESLGMVQSDFGALEVLMHGGPTPVNTIGSKILLKSGSMTPAIDRLEQRGLVERQANPNDRRVCLVALTPKGRALIERAWDDHVQVLERAMSVLSDSERATLIDLLQRVEKNAATRLGDKSG